MTEYGSLVGQIVGNYEIQRELGRGGMGVVYKAHEMSLQRVVALKILPEHLSSNPSFVKRFEREARSAARLQHPNIVTVYAIGEHNGMHYIAMEYVKGRTLSTLTRDAGRLDPRQAAEYCRQAAEALAEAHRNDIIHRDIKPHNIMVDQAGRVKMMDFGLAKILAGSSEVTAAGQLLGTPSYMSPEQCQGLDVDPRTDIYSLGITLYEMLSGQLPFRADTPLALMRQIIEIPTPPLAEFAPGIPDELCSIVHKMVAKSPNDRYTSAENLAADLNAWLRGTPTSLAFADVETAPVDSGLTGTGAARPQRRMAWIAAVAGIACAAVLGTWWVFQKSGDTDGLPLLQVTQEDTASLPEQGQSVPAGSSDEESTRLASRVEAARREAIGAQALIQQAGGQDSAPFKEGSRLIKDAESYERVKDFDQALTAYDQAIKHFTIARSQTPPETAAVDPLPRVSVAVPPPQEASADEPAEPESVQKEADPQVAKVTAADLAAGASQGGQQSVLPMPKENPPEAKPAPKEEPAAQALIITGKVKEYASGRFVDQGDGTVLDTDTMLIWQKGDSVEGFRAPRPSRSTDFRSYPDSLSLGGRSSWRLPTKGELMGLQLEEFEGKPLPFVNSGSGLYWCFVPGAAKDVLWTFDWNTAEFSPVLADGSDKFPVRAVTGP